MKIVIVGGGISGLAVYLFLQKLLSSKVQSSRSSIEVIIYETYNAAKRGDPSGTAAGEHGERAGAGFVTETIGGALGIAPNGMRVLRDLDEGIFMEINNLGYPISHFHIQNARSWSLASFPGTDKSNPPVHTILISRQGIWGSLRERVPDHVIIRKTVSRVTYGDNQHPRVFFADGSPEVEADLVIGADGVRSVVQKAILSLSGNNNDYSAVYEGLAGVGGFMPSSRLPQELPAGRLTMTLGAQGFFGYGATSRSKSSQGQQTEPGPEAVWWSTYSIEPLPDTRNFDKADIRRQLQARHATWKDPVIRGIVADATIDSIYPTWTTPTLPSWGNNGMVLVGDAAHALQSSSGQGTSQALEDAQAFCMLLSHHVERCSTQEEAIDAATKAYFSLREPRVRRIADRAKYSGDMKRKKSFVGEWVTYFFIWLIAKWPWDSFTPFVLDYNLSREVQKVLDGR